MTRDWTKTLLPASFKGFPFRVEVEGNEQGGRRVVTHEYVRGESHDTEDMGRRAQVFTVRAYLASDAADADREAFMSLLSSRGPGMLVLPVHGARMVNCTEVRSSAEKTKLGYVGFDLRFVEARASSGAPILSAFDRIAFGAAGSLSAIIGAGLSANFGGQEIPRSAGIARAGEILNSAAVILADLPALAPAEADKEAIDFDLRLIGSAIARAGTLAAVAAQVDQVAGFVHSHAEIAEAAEMQSACISLSASILAAVPATASPALANEQRIGKRIVQSLGLLLVAEAGAAAAARSFASRDQAKASRLAIRTAFDRALLAAVDAPESVIIAARESVAAAIRHIDETAGDLAPMVKIETPRALPSTLIAWRLYRDPSRAVELVASARTGTSLLMPTNFVAPAR